MTPKPLARLGVAIAVVTLGSVQASCEREASATSTSPAPVAAASLASFAANRVEFAALTPASAETLVDLPAQVVVPGDARHALAPPVPGRLLEWRVAAGDQVETGAVLATLSSLVMVGFDADVTGARAALRAHRTRVDSLQRSVDAGWATRAELSEAKVAQAEARAVLDRARAARAGTADALDQPIDAGAHFEWTSPVAGVVVERLCAPGAATDPLGTCLTVLDGSAAVVELALPESTLERAGESPSGTWFGVDGSAVALETVWTAPELDPRTRTLAVRLHPTDATALRTGSAGRVAIAATPRAGALEVPRHALSKIGGETVVFVAENEAGTAARATQVEVVGRRETNALIVGADLTADDRVAIRGVFFLKSLALLGG